MVHFLPVFCAAFSLGILTAISFERHRIIVRSDSVANKPCTELIVVFILILFAFVASLPTALGYSEYPHDSANVTSNHTDCGPINFTKTTAMSNGILLLLCTYMFPLALVAVNYSRIVFFLRKKSSQLAVQNTTISTITGNSTAYVSKRAFKSRVKTIRMLIVMTCIYWVAWMPYFVIQTIAQMTMSDNSNTAADALIMMKIFMACVAASSNGCVLLFLNRTIRNKYRQILPCLKERATVQPASTLSP
ncbi:hypothetical protein ScPMuIL_013638 [Solemya velum]